MNSVFKSFLRLLSLLLVLTLSTGSSGLRQSYLAPGQIVGGVQYDAANPTWRKNHDFAKGVPAEPEHEKVVRLSRRFVQNIGRIHPAVWLPFLILLSGCPPTTPTPSSQQKGPASQPAPPQFPPMDPSSTAHELPAFTPQQVLNREEEFGRRLLETINRLNVSRPSPIDPKPFIEWMRQARNSESGWMVSAENQRIGGNEPSWLYATATGLKFLVQQGEVDFARQLADTVVKNQNRNGSWYFGRDARTGNVFDWHAKVGDTAWMGMGLLDVYLATGEERYLNAVLRAVDFLLPFQMLDPQNRRYGSFRGGLNGEENLNWTSTENNLDIAVFFTQLAQIENPLIDRHLQGAGSSRLELLARARLVLDWMVRPSAQGGMWSENHFLIGYSNLNGTFSDFDEPTDVQTWSLLALQATRDDPETPESEGIHIYDPQDYRSGLIWILSHLKQIEFNGRRVYGFSLKPTQGINSISVDLTTGYVLAARLAGYDRLANFLEAEMRNLRDSRGFFYFIVGPENQPWFHNLRRVHQTPNHWVHFNNPFALNRDAASDRVQFRLLPERATIEAKIREMNRRFESRKGSQRKSKREKSLGGKQNKGKGIKQDPSRLREPRRRNRNSGHRGGFIGRGKAANERDVRRLIELRNREVENNLYDDWFTPALDRIHDKIYSDPDIYSEYLNPLETVVVRQFRAFYNELPDLENLFQLPSNFYVIPFEGGVANPENFLGAFARREASQLYFGIQYDLAEFLNETAPGLLESLGYPVENDRDLIAEAVFHELLHLVIPHAIEHQFGILFDKEYENLFRHAESVLDQNDLFYITRLLNLSRSLVFARVNELVENANPPLRKDQIQAVVERFSKQIWTGCKREIRSNNSEEQLEEAFNEVFQPFLTRLLSKTVESEYFLNEDVVHRHARRLQVKIFNKTLFQNLKRKMKKKEKKVLNSILDQKRTPLNQAILIFLDSVQDTKRPHLTIKKPHPGLNGAL